MQIACRDRNRIAIQATCWARGDGRRQHPVLTGDGVQAGDPAGASRCSTSTACRCSKPSASCATKRQVPVRPQAVDAAGRCFFGAAINPFAPPIDFRPHRLAKKIEAGAQFVQSQYCFDVPMFRTYMGRIRDLASPKTAFVMCGVGPLASAKTAAGIRSTCRHPHSRRHHQAASKAPRTRRRKASSLAIDISMSEENIRRFRRPCDGLPQESTSPRSSMSRVC